MIAFAAFLFLAPLTVANLMPNRRWLWGFALGACALIAGAVTCNVVYPPNLRGADMAAIGPILFGAGAALGLAARAVILWLETREAPAGNGGVSPKQLEDAKIATDDPCDRPIAPRPDEARPQESLLSFLREPRDPMHSAP